MGGENNGLYMKVHTSDCHGVKDICAQPTLPRRSQIFVLFYIIPGPGAMAMTETGYWCVSTQPLLGLL